MTERLAGPRRWKTLEVFEQLEAHVEGRDGFVPVAAAGTTRRPAVTLDLGERPIRPARPRVNMSRSDTAEREYEVEIDLDDIGDTDETDRQDRDPDDGSGGLRSRLPSPSLPSLGIVSARGLGLSLVACLAGFLAAGFLLPLGGVSGLLGLFAVGFLLGVVGRRRYVELGLAGAASAAVGTLLSQFFIAAVADLAVPIAAVGGTAGLLVTVLGHYFGRDLRTGLTQSL